MKDGGPAFPCHWCLGEPYIKQGHIWLCKIHYRFQSMRTRAKRDKKSVPSYDMLFSMASSACMHCPGCNRSMNWLAKEGRSTVVTLQHDRDGKMRFLCLSCNTRHASMPGDSFYSFPKDKKLCPDCQQQLPLEAFATDRTSRWMNKKTYCRRCSNARWKKWNENRIAC
jgi:hypothetical protein